MSAKQRREPQRPALPADPPPRGSRLWEWISASVAVALVAGLAARFALHAGGLWRDEAATAYFATLPTFGAIFERLHLDNFPLLSVCVIRTWSGAVGSSDAAYRVLGFLIALLVLGALLAHARSMGRAVTPWAGLLLFAANPVVLRAVESIRPYGIGVVLIVATHALVWRATERPTGPRLIAAAGVAVLSVQTLYQNAILVGAICASASAVAMLRGRRSEAIAPLGIGLAAAASLVPYTGFIAKAQDWSVLNRGSVSLGHLVSVAFSTIASAGPAALPLWAAAAAGALIVGARSLGPVARGNAAFGLSDRALYGALTLVAATGGFLAFLRLLQMPTQNWYYVLPLAVAAVSIDTVLSAIRQRSWNTGVRAAVAGVVIVLTIRAAWSGTAIRQTNNDLIAARLRADATTSDVVLVSPWYLAISLNRYDHGVAEIVTIPPLDDYSIHRYDLFKQRMQEAAPIDPVLDQIGATLRRGGRIWFVGGLTRLPAGAEPTRLPPAPVVPWGWSEGAYQSSWSALVTGFLMSRAGEVHEIAIQAGQPVNPLEQLPVYVFSGWREGRPATAPPRS